MSLSVARALLAAHAMGLDRLDAQLLLGHLMQRPRAWLIAHDDAIVPDDLATRFAADCQRRVQVDHVPDSSAANCSCARAARNAPITSPRSPSMIASNL